MMGKPTHISSNKKRLTKTPLKASSGILKIKSNVKPKAKNRNKSLSQSASRVAANLKTRRESRPGKSSSDTEEDEFKKCHVSSKRQRDWRPLNRSTKDFIRRAVDNNINSALGKTKAENYEEVRENLNNLKQRILHQLDQIQGPVSTDGDYDHLFSLSKHLDENLANEEEFLKTIENELERKENENDVMEQRIEENKKKLKATKEQLKQHKKQLCPLLRENFQDELNIPPVCLTSSASAHQQVSYDGAKTNLLRKLVSVQRKVETMKASSTVQNVANMLEYLEKL